MKISDLNIFLKLKNTKTLFEELNRFFPDMNDSVLSERQINSYFNALIMDDLLKIESRLSGLDKLSQTKIVNSLLRKIKMIENGIQKEYADFMIKKDQINHQINFAISNPEYPNKSLVTVRDLNAQRHYNLKSNILGWLVIYLENFPKDLNNYLQGVNHDPILNKLTFINQDEIIQLIKKSYREKNIQYNGKRANREIVAKLLHEVINFSGKGKKSLSIGSLEKLIS